jgi:hypothetical protein
VAVFGTFLVQIEDHLKAVVPIVPMINAIQ